MTFDTAWGQLVLGILIFSLYIRSSPLEVLGNYNNHVQFGEFSVMSSRCIE